jgi:histidine triad (HIT) family protein
MPHESYNPQNIFAKILRGEIPCQPVFENDHVLAFADIHPKAPVHILVVPKGAYVDAHDFYARGSDEEIVAFQRAVADIIRTKNLHEAGFRLIANAGVNGGQEVPHYHVHILGGHALGAMIRGA